MRLIKNPPREPDRNVIAQVSYSDHSGFGVVGASEIENALIFSPRGFAYRPCAGDQLLLLPVDGVDACVGALSSLAGLAPGELRLSVPSGGYFKLCQNGDAVINGVIITPGGRIIAP